MSVTTRGGWRVVYFTREPIGGAYQRMDSMLTAMGHRLVGVVTSQGPKQRRTTGYLDVVAQTRPSVDVLVSNHPERWAAMLSPLRPDLIIVGGFSWKLP